MLEFCQFFGRYHNSTVVPLLVGLCAVSFVPPDCHRDLQKDAAAIPNANPIIMDLICKYKAKI